MRSLVRLGMARVNINQDARLGKEYVASGQIGAAMPKYSARSVRVHAGVRAREVE